MKITIRAALLTLVLASLVGTPAGAQGLREVHSWSNWGGGFMVGVPVGQFRDFVNVHPGIGGAVTIGGPVGLRIGGTLLVYGHEDQIVGFPGSGGYWGYGVNTDNIIGTLGLGPQITLGAGPVRLYGYGTIGFGYFATVSSLGRRCGCYADGQTTNFDDWTLAREAGGGVQIRLARHSPAFLDLSARYMRNGRVEYLPEGSILEDADGRIVVFPVESFANLVTFQIGMSFGIR